MEFTVIHFANSVAEVFLPVGYVVTTLAYGLAFMQENALAKRWKSRLLLATTITHFLYIGMHSAEYGRCMVTTPFEIMSLIAFTILMTYAIIEYRTSIKGSGFFIIGLATVFELISAVVVKMPSAGEANPVLSEMGIGLHVSLAIFGYAGFALSAVYGVLYLLMYRELKRESIGSLYENLPSLEALEHLSIQAAIVGFLFLTISMLIGIVWLPKLIENYSYYDPKLISTVLVWLLYAGVLLAHYLLDIDGRRIIRISLGGFVFALLSMTVVNMFLSNFHRFF